MNNIEKNYYIHRLVGQAFIANPNNSPEINHKDEVKTNDKVQNIEWRTRKYNVNYGTRNIRVGLHNNRMKREIMCLTINETFNSISEAAKKYKIDRSSIIQCCKGKRNSAGSLNGKKLQWIYVL
ncbi:hypothetical protein [Clostridium sp. OS1-26]|uniref:hypothetical protein n=1 Tax=Clostridium sp. OS1-26 TaxID=3070681 RepID=UPI0027DFAF8F|nr:hypothetical protein [Clostridium sp. OS1-26]WML33193.1 hypothetical protein RCG18_17795 [Clostridium sp. OS1-26]